MSSATALADRLPSSGTSKLLGQRILDFDATASCVRVSFVATSDFLNPAGFIQGGILAAMIDDSMGPSVWLTTEGKIFPVTIDLTVSYLGAARRGSIFGEARVVQLGKTIAFLEAQLTDEAGKLIARATASARLVKADLPNEDLR